MGVILCLGVGTAAGVVPQVGGNETATVAAVDPGPGQPMAAPPVQASAETAPAPVPTVAPPTAPPTTLARRAPSTTVARARAASPAAAVAAAAPPGPAAPTGPTTATRLNPSSAQVQAAIAQVHQRIPLYQPTEAQARQFASDICDAFDQGQSYSQVKAGVQQAIPSILSISSANIDFVIRTAVGLVCPGYLPQLP